MSPSGSTNEHPSDLTERSRSETSIMASSQRFDIGGSARSLDNAMRHRTGQPALTSTASAGNLHSGRTGDGSKSARDATESH